MTADERDRLTRLEERQKNSEKKQAEFQKTTLDNQKRIEEKVSKVVDQVGEITSVFFANPSTGDKGMYYTQRDLVKRILSLEKWRIVYATIYGLVCSGVGALILAKVKDIL